MGYTAVDVKEPVQPAAEEVPAKKEAPAPVRPAPPKVPVAEKEPEYQAPHAKTTYGSI